MKPKLCLITGATAGIGKATALGLAEQGLRLILVARDEAKGAALVDELRRATSNPGLELEIADLSSQASLRALADRVRAKHAVLEVLINNAGVFHDTFGLTADGIERQFAVNHLSYFLLTHLLLGPLQAAAEARIVNVTSNLHRFGTIDFADPYGARHYYAGVKSYSQSKLANVLFTYELARRLGGTNVAANCVHPGSVRTAIGSRHTGWPVATLFSLYTAIRSVDPREGAATTLYLATSPDVRGTTGKFFVNRSPRRSARLSYDPELAARLFQLSEGLTGLPPSPSSSRDQK
jgi:NAD(P)-dependent dehydrogenase (short-subunit alcohol dehydrogenase family)